MRGLIGRLAVAGTALVLAVGLTGSGSSVAQPPQSTPRSATTVQVVAVGDIACDPQSPFVGAAHQCRQGDVGALVDTLVRGGAQWFFTLGDAQYETGRYRDFRASFDPAFRSVRSVTKAVAGNHEYYTSGARGHFRYWGRHAGTPEQPWRTFVPASGWRVLLLDSNCDEIGGCGPRSREGRWLRRVLAANTTPCTLAMWHHPFRTSGEYAGNVYSKSLARPLWRASNRGGVDVVLNGHDHIYERFAKFSDVQQFTVGTGGKSHYRITTTAPGSLTRIAGRYGVLRLGLSSDGSYSYAFVSTSGRVLDRGSSRCTNEPSR